MSGSLKFYILKILKKKKYKENACSEFAKVEILKTKMYLLGI